jgi:hypothetical protein
MGIVFGVTDTMYAKDFDSGHSFLLLQRPAKISGVLSSGYT